MINESGNKVVGILKRCIVEVEKSQSSVLATGYLPFDKTKIVAILNLAIKEIESSEITDFSESHSCESKELGDYEGCGEKVSA